MPARAALRCKAGRWEPTHRVSHDPLGIFAPGHLSCRPWPCGWLGRCLEHRTEHCAIKVLQSQVAKTTAVDDAAAADVCSGKDAAAQDRERTAAGKRRSLWAEFGAARSTPIATLRPASPARHEGPRNPRSTAMPWTRTRQPRSRWNYPSSWMVALGTTDLAISQRCW